MKVLANSHVWWKRLDKNLEELERSCCACLSVKQSPAKALLHPWTWLDSPWQRLDVDFAGPFLNQSFLIAVDEYSKWAAVVEMTHTTMEKSIATLRHLFATQGINKQIVSDNGPQFTSSDFKFMRINGIEHSQWLPYHPSSNNKAEQFVRTFKEGIKAAKNDGLTLFCHDQTHQK